MSSPPSIASTIADLSAVAQDLESSIVRLMSTEVAVVNQSTVLTDAEVEAVLPALRRQVVGDFAPIWGRSARLAFFSRTAIIPPQFWQLQILDDATQAGVLGFHEVTQSGQPLGQVFAKTTIADGLNWTVTVSHELLEMLGDPYISWSVEVDDASGNPSKFLALEVCDAPEDDQWGYLIDNVLLSDFVTPAWFVPGSFGPWDFKGHITAPLTLIAGGYSSELDLPSGTGWRQVQARSAPGERTAPNIRSDRRHEMRRRPRAEWRRSER